MRLLKGKDGQSSRLKKGVATNQKQLLGQLDCLPIFARLEQLHHVIVQANVNALLVV